MKFSLALQQFIDRFFNLEDQSFHQFALENPQAAVADLPADEAAVVRDMLAQPDKVAFFRPTSFSWF